MKIEEGKFYRTRDGRKVGPMRELVTGLSFESIGVTVEGVRSWWTDGCAEFNRSEHMADLIAEWTDEPTFDPLDPPVFGELTDAQKGELLLHAHNGGEIEMMNCGKWAFVHPAFSAGERYRKKPQPVRETVEVFRRFIEGRYRFMVGEALPMDTHRITFDTIDGKPVCGSIKMEAL